MTEGGWVMSCCLLVCETECACGCSDDMVEAKKKTKGCSRDTDDGLMPVVGVMRGSMTHPTSANITNHVHRIYGNVFSRVCVSVTYTQSSNLSWLWNPYQTSKICGQWPHKMGINDPCSPKKNKNMIASYSIIYNQGYKWSHKVKTCLLNGCLKFPTQVKTVKLVCSCSSENKFLTSFLSQNSANKTNLVFVSGSCNEDKR